MAISLDKPVVPVCGSKSTLPSALEAFHGIRNLDELLQEALPLVRATVGTADLASRLLAALMASPSNTGRPA